ncbi:MAG: DUF488 domain-containing protein [Sulfolobales archaeon]|nr:DUF488 domain-containing protein [Sulfolobales archaeon]MDW8082565.1 DUF488 domain-containing protein [Sulfolobales archaeon]
MLREVFTLGYDTLEIEDFVAIILHYCVEVVVDVRRWGKSVRMPQYSTESLARELTRNGIRYIWIPELGGFRSFGSTLVDVGIGRCFKSEGFRAYATYILTSSEAREALKRLLDICSNKVAALLCCERIPYRCHRKILSDWLLYRGFKVIHIVPPNEFEHRYTKCARVVEGELTYV